jgi:GNAT superfamily N-acetyltransferase
MPAAFITIERPPYSISTDPARLDLALITEYLARSYWAEGIPPDVMERAVQGSLCFGIYEGTKQVGFARCVTDAATFAYLADVFVLESHRGRGLSRWLMEVIMAHPDLQGLRRFSLVTRDAHGLYAKFGFTPLAKPEGYMEIVRRGIYLAKKESI